MTSFSQIIHRRRSCRQFDNREISAEDLSKILESALLSPSARNARQWRFYIVDNGKMLEKLSDAKELGSQFIKTASVAVVIACDEKDDPNWIEDCSVAAITMQYQAEDLGLGSCWCQIRDAYLSDGTASEQIVRGITDIPDNERIHSIIALGYKKENKEPAAEREALWERVKIVGE